MKKMTTQEKRLQDIEDELKKKKSDTEKRLFLAFELKKEIQDAIKRNDPDEGRFTPVHRFIRAELRYMSACRRIQKETETY
jgi:hypothetical protein